MSELDERPIMIFLDCGNPECETKWMAAGTYEGVEGSVPRVMDERDRICPSSGCRCSDSIVREWGPLKFELMGKIWVVAGQPWIWTPAGYNPAR
ncbi:MAG TPA: hypothetical protein VGE59_04910 [Patescibacteria group bacterium]